MDTQLQAIEVVNLDSLGHNFSPITNSIPNAMFSCNDNSNVYLPHQLSSTNSFELNAITSLSDDSGVPLTNSSTSSGDSCRLELCKLELELVESEGEVSQFDSLDNCSDGGMSAENFNTLKKGPLAPIDPPPEFQDSPQTTLVRSQLIQNFATKLSIQLLETAMTYYAYHTLLSSIEECSSNATNFFTNNSSHDTDLGGSIDIHKKHVYASDLTLNKSRENIYDEPNTEYNFSHDDKLQCGGKYPPIRRFEIGRQQDQESSKSQKIGWPYLSELHCYDFHYAVKKIGQYDSFQQKKAPVLYSPLQHHTANSTGNRPNSRNSINSRLSSSHNSLSLPHANKADDSIFITQAMSHDALIGREISDFYNVPIDSDIYAYPVDMINSDSNDLYKSKSLRQQKRHELKTAQYNKKKYRNNALESGETTDKSDYKLESMRSNEKRHSVPGSALRPMNMTLEEVKLFYHNLYSSSSESNETLNNKNKSHQQKHNKFFSKSRDILTDSKKSKVSSHQHTPAASIGSPGGGGGGLKNNISNIKKKKKIEKCGLKLSSSNTNNNNNNNNSSKPANQLKKSQFSINLNLKQKFCSIFRFRKSHHTSSNEQNLPTTGNYVSKCPTTTKNESNSNKRNFSTRALPPLPSRGRLRVILNENQRPEYNSAIHFASNIERVKNYGWYWGPISSEAAEKILSNEPDGSFIVRDSSDDHYIFSLSFKLNSCVRHVRIEQDQGTFSFGSYAKFKSQTITEFIEKAVEHSRSGRYLFFLHRRPEHGPMRVQLTNPVSRFKHIQSLQHMCRFVILKAVVRRDLIPTLPLPRRLQDYLSSKHCYSEQVESDSSQSQVSEDEGSSISSH